MDQGDTASESLLPTLEGNSPLFTYNKLKDEDQFKLFTELAQHQIDHIRQSAPLVADKLEELRDLSWNNSKPMAVEARRERVNEIISGLTPEQDELLCSSLARMGELYNLAGLTARDNYLEAIHHHPEPEKLIPGGVREFIANETANGKSDLKTTIEKLSTPVFEMTVTMHPTGIMNIDPLKRLRDIAFAIRNDIDSDDHTHEATRKAIAAYQDTPILHRDGQGRESNMTVRDEVKAVLNSLSNLYEDSTEVYHRFDRAFVAAQQEKGENYNPLDLRLNVRLNSWAGGDKDGNNNVTAEVTLETLIRHSYEIIGHYQKDLEAIKDPDMEKWKTSLAEARESLGALLARAEALTDQTDAMRAPGSKTSGDSIALGQQFEQLSHELAEIRKGLDAKQFENDLKGVYHKHGEDADNALDMSRKVQWFGFNFANLEYRETAEEYSKVLEYFVSGYKEMPAEDKIKALTNALLHNEIDPAKASEIIAKGTTHHLSEEGEAGKEAIAYHTLRRMQLARDHSDMIKNNVLAECGKIDEKDNPAPTAKDIAEQGQINMLEAQFLQRAVGANAEGRHALMGIVPLFEDKSTMENIDKIMAATYDNSAYKQHMQALKEDRGYDNITQQVQIAHSDNRRRAGSLAGTAYIHEAHRKVRQLNEERGIDTQFYEGGSWTDAFRNGVRSITAQVNAYKLQDFAKFTVQGVSDLTAYLNHPGAISRLLVRQMVHSASKMQWNEDQAKYVPDAISNGSRAPNPVMDEVATEALKTTYKDYSKEDFKRDAIGIIVDTMGLRYQREATASNRGSRAAMRGTASVKVGAMIEGIGVDKLRTIPFSAVQQLNELTPSWVGGQNLRIYLYDEITKKIKDLQSGTQSPDAPASPVRKAKDLSESEQAFLRQFGDIPLGLNDEEAKQKAVRTTHLNAMYEGSPTFRDAIDKAAFAVARTDMDTVVHNVSRNLESNLAATPVKQAGSRYLKLMMETYQKMGSVIYKALLGDKAQEEGPGKPSKYLERPTQFGNIKASAIEALQLAHSHEALDAANGMGPEIFRRNQFLNVINLMKNRMDTEQRLGGDDNNLALLTAAGQSSVLGRFLEADDPAMAKRKHQDHEKERKEQERILFSR